MTKNELQLNIFEMQQMIRKLMFAQSTSHFPIVNEKDKMVDIFRSISHLMEELMLLCVGEMNEPDKPSSASLSSATQSKRHLMTQMIINNPKNIGSEEVNLKEILNNIEVAYIQDALAKEKGIVTHAAKRLGIRRTTLVEKMKKFEMTNQKETLIKEQTS